MRVTLICPAGTATEFAVGAGRTEDSRFAEWLTAEDVASAVVHTLEQPRSLRIRDLDPLVDGSGQLALFFAHG